MATWTPKDKDEDGSYNFQTRNGIVKVRGIRFTFANYGKGYAFIDFQGTRGELNAGGCVPAELMDVTCKDYLESRGYCVYMTENGEPNPCPVYGGECHRDVS